jgi:catalase
MSDERPVTTTDAGIPAASDEFSLTAGPSGPTVLHDHYVVQKMQHFNRERVPERVVHAKGSGAHGFFEVTEDVTGWTKASFLAAVGQRTPVFARFSTVAGELGSPDTWRDPRGFAVKLYTEEGNFDLVCNNTRLAADLRAELLRRPAGGPGPGGRPGLVGRGRRDRPLRLRQARGGRRLRVATRAVP